MKDLVCNLCAGAGKLRHEQPPEMSDEDWQKIVLWGKCPLCWKNPGVQPHIRVPLVDTLGRPKMGVVGPEMQVVPRNVFFWRSKTSDRIFVACLDLSCPKWADATGFVSRGKVYTQVPIAECPNGHQIRMDFKIGRA